MVLPNVNWRIHPQEAAWCALAFRGQILGRIDFSEDQAAAPQKTRSHVGQALPPRRAADQGHLKSLFESAYMFGYHGPR